MGSMVLVRDKRNHALYEHRVVMKNTTNGTFHANEIRPRKGRTTKTQPNWRYIKSIDFKQNFFNVLNSVFFRTPD